MMYAKNHRIKPVKQEIIKLLTHSNLDLLEVRMLTQEIARDVDDFIMMVRMVNADMANPQHMLNADTEILNLCGMRYDKFSSK